MNGLDVEKKEKEKREMAAFAINSRGPTSARDRSGVKWV